MKPWELTKKQREEIPILCDDWHDDAAIIGFDYQKKLLEYLQSKMMLAHTYGLLANIHCNDCDACTLLNEFGIGESNE